MSDEQVGIHNPGNWSAGKNGYCVVSDQIGGGVHGSDDVEYYGGHMICESIGRSNIPIVTAAPRMLKVLVSVRKAMEPWDVSLADAMVSIDRVIAEATMPIPPVPIPPVPSPPVDSVANPVSDPACDTDKAKPPLGVMPRYLWLESRRDDLYAAIFRYREAMLQVSTEWLFELAHLERELGGICACGCDPSIE